MRLFFVLCFFTLFFSCNNEEKHYGDWIYDYRNSTVYADIPSRIKISKDSIKFRYPYFEYWHSFPVKISNNKLEYNNIEFKTVFDKDTLNLNKYFRVFRPEVSIKNSQYLREENFVNINLPKVNYTFEKVAALDRSALILYGKRIDNGQYSLNLNDKYSDFKDLPRFLYDHHGIRKYNSSVLLFCDKNTKLMDLEKMIIQFQVSYKYRIAFVNDIIIGNNTYEPFYNYSILNLKLPPLIEDDKYISEINGYQLPAPPPSQLLDNSDLNTIIIKLIKNKIFINNKEVVTSKLLMSVIKRIENNSLIITLYDLESNYNSFIEMMAIINEAYNIQREHKSRFVFKKSFKDLSPKDSQKIKKIIPKNWIWSYSIPHLNSLIEENGNFLGLNINTIN